MVDHKSSPALKSSRIVSESLANDQVNMHDFWFGMRSYLHSSWLEKSKLTPILYKQNKKASKFVWNGLYQNICQELEVDSKLKPEELSGDMFWWLIIDSIIKSPFLSMAFVGSCMRIDNDLSFIDFNKNTDENIGHENIDVVDKYPTSEVIDYSFSQKKSAFQVKTSLSLDRRFKSLMLNDDILTGLCLLNAFLAKENIALWQRLRLMYDKKSINFVENHIDKQEFSPANHRCLKRLWKFTNETILSS